MRIRPRSVAFVVESVPALDALHLFFLTLVSACGSEQLSQISLATLTKRQRSHPDQQVSLSTFQSLFGLPNIDTLEFDGSYNIIFDDDAITALAKRWPKLTSISVNKGSGWGITSRVTTKGLITLLSRCTALTDFALEVDLSGIDVEHVEPLGLHPGSGVTNEKCRAANFVMSKIKYPAAVAAFLSDICPELETVESAWFSSMHELKMNFEEMHLYIDSWYWVRKLLPAFSMMRKQYMEWAQERGEEGSLKSA